MSSILVLEPEPRTMERIHHALSAEGWRVRTVQEPSQILQAAAAEAPDLVILSTAVAGVETIAGSLMRNAGGPGVVGLLPEGGTPAAAGLQADELLAKPFDEQALREVVRRVVTARRPPVAVPHAGVAETRLTSLDIFGDVLAEVEGMPETPAAAPVPAPPPAPARPPLAAAPAPAPPRPASPPRQDQDVQRRLEKTLSGVLGMEARPRPASPAPPPRPAPPAAAAAPAVPVVPVVPRSSPARRVDADTDDIDAILNRTLSALDAGARPKPAPPRPEPPRPAPPADAPPAPPPAPTPALRPVSAAAPVQESTAVRRSPRPVDHGMAELEELARAARKPDVSQPVREATKSGAGATPAVPRPVPTPAAAPAPAPPPAAPSPPLAAVPEPPHPAAPPAAAPAAPVFDLDELPPLPELPLPVEMEPEPPPVEIAAPPPPPAAEPLLAPARVAEDIAATQRIPVFTGEETFGDQPGERFGQYTLLEKIAAGGMAEVWKARMRGVEGFQKTVAIKKILPHMTDNTEFIGMFIDEAKLAAQLSHPNIVHIYDLGKINRDYYIAMEYVEGRDLRSILNAAWRKGVRLPLGLALLVGARLASALDYAHRKRDFEGRELGLVHRDVSPQNVLISYEGDVKLCDFGIAKAVSKAGQTQMGALKGKLQYMSPEQAWGRPIDARSDIFSLGAVLFEMIAGERLFTGESEMSVLESVRQGRVRRLRELDPSVPAEVEAVVGRALAYEPQDRFPSAGEMMQRIEEALHGLSPSTGPTDLALWLQRALAPEADSGAALAPLRPAAAPPVPAPEPPPVALPVAEGEPAEPVEAVAPLGEVRVEEGGGRKVLLYAAIALLIVAVIVTLFVLNRPRGGQGEAAPGGDAAPSAPVPAVQTPAPAAGPPVAPTAPQANPAAAGPVDVAGIVGEEMAKREEELRRQHEKRLAEEQKRIAQELSRKPAETPAPQETPKIPATPAITPQAAPPAAAAPPPPEPEPAPVQEAPRPGPQSEPEPPRPQERVAPPEPEAPRVRTGDLVAGGPGVTPPALVSVPKPEYPPVARRLQVQGVVVLSVLVDENGQVEDVRLVEPIKQKVGLNEAAVAAARRARYRPATKDGVRVKMWTRLPISFKL